MTPLQMSAVHAAAFQGQGRAWSEDEFAGLLQEATVFAVHAPGAFALGRVVADEAELLTIATAPDKHRIGLGRRMLAGFEAEAVRRGARAAFLDVAEDNHAATALYASAGYCEIARRRAYYRRSDADDVDALVLRKSLT